MKFYVGENFTKIPQLNFNFEQINTTHLDIAIQAETTKKVDRKELVSNKRMIPIITSNSISDRKK
ncbi:hypothetical protein YC2023_008505 [Brassica napus]